MNFRTISLGLAATAAVAASSVIAIAPAQAATFDKIDGIQFDSNTLVNFEFLGGDGLLTAIGANSFGLSIMSSDTVLFSGEFAAIGDTTSFEFLGGQTYRLFLENSFSGKLDQATNAIFTGDDPFAGILISWEDIGVATGGDFNDYFVRATAVPTSIPTPALLPGLIGMGIAALRKRQSEQSKQAI